MRLISDFEVDVICLLSLAFMCYNAGWAFTRSCMDGFMSRVIKALSAKDHDCNEHTHSQVRVGAVFKPYKGKKGKLAKVPNDTQEWVNLFGNPALHGKEEPRKCPSGAPIVDNKDYLRYETEPFRHANSPPVNPNWESDLTKNGLYKMASYYLKRRKELDEEYARLDRWLGHNETNDMNNIFDKERQFFQERAKMGADSFNGTATYNLDGWERPRGSGYQRDLKVNNANVDDWEIDGEPITVPKRTPGNFSKTSRRYERVGQMFPGHGDTGAEPNYDQLSQNLKGFVSYTPDKSFHEVQIDEMKADIDDGHKALKPLPSETITVADQRMLDAWIDRN